MSDPGFRVTIDPAEFRNFGLAVRAFEPALYRRMRKELRDIGQESIDGIKDELGKSSPDGGPDTGRNRAALISATRVSISFGARAGGVKIVTSPSRLPEGHKELLAAYNMRRFRHPVFGDRDTWQDQQGRPYFYGPIKKNLTSMTDRMGDALDDAMRAIGARGL